MYDYCCGYVFLNILKVHLHRKRFHIHPIVTSKGRPETTCKHAVKTTTVSTIHVKEVVGNMTYCTEMFYLGS